MTELLERATAEAARPPAAAQDRIAASLLQELEGDARRAIIWFRIGSHAEYDGLLERL